MTIWFNANTPNAATVAFSGSAAGMYGIVGSPGELSLGNDQFPGVQQTDRTVLIRTDQKGVLKPDSSITVGGTAYTVRYLQPIDDGLITLVFLR